MSCTNKRIQTKPRGYTTISLRKSVNDRRAMTILANLSKHTVKTCHYSNTTVSIRLCASNMDGFSFVVAYVIILVTTYSFYDLYISMTYLFLLYSMTLFAIFFVQIQYPRLALLPAGIFLVFIVNGLGTITPSSNFRQVIENNSLYIARRTTLAGISGLCSFLGIDRLYTSIYITLFNII